MTRWMLVAAVILATATAAMPADRWLHVRVEDGGDGSTVKVNVPLSLAEKILPTINQGELHNGKVTINHGDLNGVDLKAIFEAVRTSPDNEFVTVESKDADVRVAKKDGKFVVRIHDKEKGKTESQEVEVLVPMEIVDALTASGRNELDLVAAIRALGAAGDITLVTVTDGKDHVRVWVDSRAQSE